MVEAEEMKKCQDLLNKILADNTGKDIKLIEEACKTDKWFTAQEAFDFGLIDTIITKKE
jgi:ATP-dependent Clp protease protease subunit